MPEYSPSDNDAAGIAANWFESEIWRAAESLNTRAGKPFRPYEIRKPDASIYLADVMERAGEFASQFASHIFRGEVFPCLRLANNRLLPMNVRPNDRRDRRQIRRSPDSIVFVKAQDALQSFSDGLRAFLVPRFAAPRHSSGGTSAGYKFTVTTHSSGLNVYYSPAYFFTANDVFGQPSTPVSRNDVQPGRYVFGAGGGSIRKWFDLASEYDIPGNTTASLPV
jgi:hypothetical protein